jgi:hypothetical protein
VELWREAGDVLSTSLLPGLDLPLAGIFDLSAVALAEVED